MPRKKLCSRAFASACGCASATSAAQAVQMHISRQMIGRETRAFAKVASAAALLRAGRRAAQPASESEARAALRASSLCRGAVDGKVQSVNHRSAQLCDAGCDHRGAAPVQQRVWRVQLVRRKHVQL